MKTRPAALIILVTALAAPLLLADNNPLQPYPSPSQRDAEVQQLARAFPDRVEIIEYGKSVEGRPLKVIRIHRPGSGQKPAAWIGANIHGNEWVGNRMAMAMARMLLEEDGTDPMITEAMDAMDFFIVPCINPDGYQKTWEKPEGEGKVVDMGATLSVPGGEEEGGWGHTRKNMHGVDLNRNWPIPGKVTIPIDWAGSPDPDSVHYRGPAPLSEPETAAIDAFFEQHPEIVAAISWHSTAGVQFPPRCPSRACMKRHKKMCKAFKQNQPHIKYPRLQTRVFDTYTGEMEDWLYAEYGVLAMDVEISKSGLNKKACECDSLFWSFNPQNLDFWIENDAKAGIAAMVEANRVLGGKRILPAER